MRQTSAARRSVVAGFNGAVATSQPLAAQAGLRMLLAGGNAVDAALAAAATLNVVEPSSTGMGGDAFALVYWAKDRRVYALNASGRSAYAATLDHYLARGLTTIPDRDILAVTVPGATAGWADLAARFGRLGLDRALQPAIDYAERGYPLSERIAAGWGRVADVLAVDRETARVFLPGGAPPRAGQKFANPDLARSLRLLAEQGPDVFYRGELAQALVATSDSHGGLLTLQDMADHTSTWVEPIHTEYRGHRVWECPPNGQGIAVLMALNILQGYDLQGMGFDSTDALHLKMEAVKLGMTDAARYVADPEVVDLPTRELLSDAYAQTRRNEIDLERAIALPQPGAPPRHSDTIYLTVVDGEGNACSFINSLCTGFGAAITVQGAGILLQNRGASFRLDAEHPNCLAPHKRPYHTIIPAMVTRQDAGGDDILAICFGVMGGFMQPQGQVQVLTNILDHGMNPQQALDAPRFAHQSGNLFHLEPYYAPHVYAELRARGHEIPEVEGYFGGGQVIMVDPESGALLAGAEPRNDGAAVAF